MKLFLAIITVVLILPALFIDFFSFVVNVRRLIFRKHTVSGVPLIALVFYIFVAQLPTVSFSPMPQIMRCLVLFHFITHIVIPLVSYGIGRFHINFPIFK